MTETPQHKLMPTEEMIEAGVKAALDATHAETWTAGVTEIYLAMEAARPTTDVDGLVERLNRAADKIAEAFGEGFVAELCIREAANRIEALQRSNAELVARVTGALNLLLDGQIQDAKNAFREALEDKTVGGKTDEKPV